MQTGLADRLLRAVLIGGVLFMLAASLPGHLSVDSIMQLYEGRMGVRETFGPPIYARILGLLDGVVPGTGLYVTASALLLLASLLALRGLRGRTAWTAVPVALAVVLTPDLLVYQGIVWKDVLFANLSIAAFVCLAAAAQRWEGRWRWPLLIAALGLLAVAALVRQNGLIAAAMAAVALGLTARGRWPVRLGWGVGGFVAVLLLAQVLNAAAQPKTAGPDTSMDVGLRILLHYDITGALAHDPTLKLEAIDKANRASDDILRAEAPKVYSPERVDFLDRSQLIGPSLWPLPKEAVRAAWADIVIHHPAAYLKHRWGAFRWVFFQPMVERCVPVHVGIAGPPDKLAALGYAAGQDGADLTLYNYATWYYGTPLYSHLTYALIAAAVAGLVMLRRDPADIVIAALMVAALGFAASFFMISIACDYRYLYFLDLAALTGLLYLSIDPAVWRRRRE